MKIRSLHITNAGPFEDLSLTLHPNVSCFYGCGKSTVLRSLALVTSGLPYLYDTANLHTLGGFALEALLQDNPSEPPFHIQVGLRHATYQMTSSQPGNEEPNPYLAWISQSPSKAVLSYAPDSQMAASKHLGCGMEPLRVSTGRWPSGLLYERGHHRQASEPCLLPHASQEAMLRLLCAMYGGRARLDTGGWRQGFMWKGRRHKHEDLPRFAQQTFRWLADALMQLHLIAGVKIPLRGLSGVLIVDDVDLGAPAGALKALVQWLQQEAPGIQGIFSVTQASSFQATDAEFVELRGGKATTLTPQHLQGLTTVEAEALMVGAYQNATDSRVSHLRTRLAEAVEDYRLLALNPYRNDEEEQRVQDLRDKLVNITLLPFEPVKRLPRPVKGESSP